MTSISSPSCNSSASTKLTGRRIAKPSPHFATRIVHPQRVSTNVYSAAYPIPLRPDFFFSKRGTGAAMPLCLRLQCDEVPLQQIAHARWCYDSPLATPLREASLHRRATRFRLAVSSVVDLASAGQATVPINTCWPTRSDSCTWGRIGNSSRQRSIT